MRRKRSMCRHLLRIMPPLHLLEEVLDLIYPGRLIILLVKVVPKIKNQKVIIPEDNRMICCLIFQLYN